MTPENDVRTYRASSLGEALALIRAELGADAAILHSRQVPRNVVSRLLFGTEFEVAASAWVNVPSRFATPAEDENATVPFSLPATTPGAGDSLPAEPVLAEGVQLTETSGETPEPLHTDYAAQYRTDLRLQMDSQLQQFQTLVDKLQHRTDHLAANALPDSLFQIFTDLIELDVEEEIARYLVDRIRSSLPDESMDRDSALAALNRQLQLEMRTAGPIHVEPHRTKIVALVGPTGVGKTTTIAKLAANFRLRQRCRVGLITVDTYRVAAVEQLRTYADIIDLPMEVVSTPREMRQARARMQDLDLVLMDTAGRSPRDEVRIQELKAMLGEAEPDEIHLVLSCTSSSKSMIRTAREFSQVSLTALVLTKIDEAHSLGHLLTLMRHCHYPISYLTDGQDVPDDISVARGQRLATLLLPGEGCHA